MKILHTGDVHLDSPFAHLSAAAAAERRSELRATFSDMMAYARTEAVDLLLIAGDLFDRQFVTRDTVALLQEEFAALPCPVIIAPGNHDPAEEGSVWKKHAFPENVHVFTEPTLRKISLDELSCDVYGYAFTEPTLRDCPLSGKTVEDPEKINLLCVHGDTTSPISTYGPLPGAVLTAFGADYTALAHIHNPEAANAALPVPGAYCGCPEGRDFGEAGRKGALLVTVDKIGGEAHVASKFVRFCRKVYEVRRLNVDGAATGSDVAAAIRRLCAEEGLGADVLLRVILQGSVDPALNVNPTVLANDKKELCHLEVRDETVPTWNAALLQSDPGIRGELYRVLLPRLESADAAERRNAAAALRLALAALAGADLPLRGREEESHAN